MSNNKIADPKLADAGRLRIEWAESRMPVLMHLRDQGKKDLPLRGMKVAGCLHVTKETAVLIRTIRAAGAEVSWSGCNPLSTQDDVEQDEAGGDHRRKREQEHRQRSQPVVVPGGGVGAVKQTERRHRRQVRAGKEDSGLDPPPFVGRHHQPQGGQRHDEGDRDRGQRPVGRPFAG